MTLDRTQGMGSTDVVEVAGLAPWQGAGPWRVYNAKTGIATEDQADPDGTLAWGHEMERMIREWYGRQVGYPVFACHPVESLRQSWLWASPDGVGPGNRYYEIKNVGSFMAHMWDRSDDDGIPHHVRGQVQIGMYCAQAREWTVIAAIGGLPPRIWTVQYDPELAEMLVEEGRKFWTDHVVPRKPPPVDASDACREYLRKKYPRDEREMVESTLEQDELAARRIEAARLGKDAAEEVRLLDSQLLANIGEAKGIRGVGWKMTWKVDKNGVRRSRFTEKDDE